MEFDREGFEDAGAELTGSTPGRILKMERERLGLSSEEIAIRLRLRVGVIEALERDDYREMAADVFMKGYLRSYAKLLNLEPEGVMQAFDALGMEHKPKPAVSHLWQNLSPAEKKEKPFKAMIMISAGFAALLCCFWLANTLIFNKKNNVVESETLSMNVLGTKDLALTDISTLQTEKVKAIHSTKPASQVRKNPPKKSKVS